MPETRNDELYRALKHNGYPDDFCREIAYRQMNTDFTATRMLGYLSVSYTHLRAHRDMRRSRMPSSA